PRRRRGRGIHLPPPVRRLEPLLVGFRPSLQARPRGALLRDLDRLLLEETGLPVHVAEDPLTCVVRGSGIALERMDKLGGVFSQE
ncbi:MAG: hypothetical protein RIR85_900, partial [Pseudomonadota bacterium]